LTVNSLNFDEYSRMTDGNKEQFRLLIKAISLISKVFKGKTTLNIVVTKINFNSIRKVLSLAQKEDVKVKLLEMTNGKKFSNLYVPFAKIKRSFKGDNIEYVNSCCPSNNCRLCKRLYPVVRLSPDGKINGCIMNERQEREIIKFIKDKNEIYIRKALLNCLNNKRGAK
jgi:molybdenum cofactor biosynthesis enzyme MoaA